MLTYKLRIKKGGLPWRTTLYRDKLVSIMDDINLIDFFRKHNPNERSFSHESKSLKFSSRIEPYLVSSEKIISNWVDKAPDHKAVVLDLRIPSKKRGPGLWKFLK